MNNTGFRTYRLQVVVFFSFLALFSLIVAGIVVYGYRSNSESPGGKPAKKFRPTLFLS